MKLIFAQGNPGAQYARTRHNVGFIILDTLVEQIGAKWRTESKFKAEIAEPHLDGEKILLVKPLSFYNETGLVARGLIDFYKLNPSKDILVVHDELALPFGSIRIRDKGSDAGNNGIKSLNSHLGPLYWRLRIGVWNELRDRMNDADFVLSSFSNTEHEQLLKLTPTLWPIFEAFVEETLEAHSKKANQND